MNVYYTKTIKSSPFIVTFSAEEEFSDFLIGGYFLDMVNELIDRVKKQKEQLNNVNLDSLFILQGETHA